MLIVSQPTSKIDIAIRTGPDFYRDAAWSIWVGYGLRRDAKEGERRYRRNFEWSTAFLPYLTRDSDGINGFVAFGRHYVLRKYRPQYFWP